MKKQIIFGSTLLFGSILFTGCFDNPLGVGYEHSTCEASTAFGVCGAPRDIYLNRDKIKQVQENYIKSGYDKSLYFSVTNDGSILAKDERTGKWENYETSNFKKEIDELLAQRTQKEKALKAQTKTANVNYALTDIPVTENTDLSVVYKKQGSIIESRTNIGNMIRDNGLIQKIWVAPVVDKKGDLISSHDIYVVVKEAKWAIGEATPSSSTEEKITQIPTPISQAVLDLGDKSSENENALVNAYNADDKGGLIEAISKDPMKNNVEFQQNMNQIQNYIKE